MKKVFKIVGIIAASSLLTSGIIIGYGYYCIYTMGKAMDEGSEELHRSIDGKLSMDTNSRSIEELYSTPEIDITDNDSEIMEIANNGVLQINKGNEKEIQKNCNILHKELIENNYNWADIFRNSLAARYLIDLLPCDPDKINVEDYLIFMSESTKESRAKLNLVDYFYSNYDD